MTTSANVIEYNILNKSGDIVGHHRQNVLCKTCNDGLEKFIPASDYIIQPYGYDMEEEAWEGESVGLFEWLKKNPAEISFLPDLSKKIEIYNGKKIIASFMGLKKIKHLEKITDENRHLKDCYYLPLTEKIFWELDELKYDNSWDWLMPVWAKITTDTANFSKEFFFKLNEQKFHEGMQMAMITTDINFAFTCLVDAIKWIKKNK